MYREDMIEQTAVVNMKQVCQDLQVTCSILVYLSQPHQNMSRDAAATDAEYVS